jgi:hypothetical protein
MSNNRFIWDGSFWNPTGVAFGIPRTKTRARGEQTPRGEDGRWGSGGSAAQKDAAYAKAVKDDPEKARKMLDAHAKDKGYNIQPLKHGTTHDFDEFRKEFANNDGNMGGGFYFTNSDMDAEHNYAGEGADVTARVEKLAEDITSNLEFEPEWEDRDYEEMEEEGMRQARAKLIGGKFHTLEAYIGLANPCTLGGDKPTTLEAELPEENEDGDWMGEPSGLLIDFGDALKSEVWEDSSAVDAVSEVLGNYWPDGGSVDEIIEDLLGSGLAHWENPDTNGMDAPEAIRAALEAIGFDGVIDKTVNSKFGTTSKMAQYGVNMSGMDHDTVHTIVFQPEAIKDHALETKDAKGKVIPLSERFDRGSKKIWKNARTCKAKPLEEQTGRDAAGRWSKEGGATAPVNLADNYNLQEGKYRWSGEVDPNALTSLTIRRGKYKEAVKDGLEWAGSRLFAGNPITLKVEWDSQVASHSGALGTMGVNVEDRIATIYLSPKQLAKDGADPGYAAQIAIHELVHIWQRLNGWPKPDFNIPYMKRDEELHARELEQLLGNEFLAENAERIGGLPPSKLWNDPKYFNPDSLRKLGNAPFEQEKTKAKPMADQTGRDSDGRWSRNTSTFPSSKDELPIPRTHHKLKPLLREYGEVGDDYMKSSKAMYGDTETDKLALAYRTNKESTALREWDTHNQQAKEVFDYGFENYFFACQQLDALSSFKAGMDRAQSELRTTGVISSLPAGLKMEMVEDYMVPTTKPLMVFRGHAERVDRLDDILNSRRLVDFGVASTSSSRASSEEFLEGSYHDGNKHRANVMYHITLPPGTPHLAIDALMDGAGRTQNHEDEVVLMRGAEFEVGAYEYDEDRDEHIVELNYIGQANRSAPPKTKRHDPSGKGWDLYIDNSVRPAGSQPHDERSILLLMKTGLSRADARRYISVNRGYGG